MRRRPESAGKAASRRASALEIGLLVVGLAALALGAGAVGWAIGQGTRSTSTVTVAGAPAPANGKPTSAPTVKGDPAAGKSVFVNSGCGSCHTLAETGAKGTGGPNLDQVKLTPSEILDWVKNGKGAMPSFKAQLSKKDLANVTAFLTKAENH